MAIPASTVAHTALSISFETEHCRVRELEPSDASEVICGWMSDPDVARGLNAPVRAISMDELRRYIAQHDRVTGHLLGVYRKQDGALIGLWSVYVDWEHSEFLMNVLMRGRIDGELGAMRETARELYKIMFRDLGLGTMRYNILASNQGMHDRARVLLSATKGSAHEPEHVSATRAASGQGAETIQHYRMTREDWLRHLETQEARDALWREARKARRTGDA